MTPVGITVLMQFQVDIYSMHPDKHIHKIITSILTSPLTMHLPWKVLGMAIHSKLYYLGLKAYTYTYVEDTTVRMLK